MFPLGGVLVEYIRNGPKGKASSSPQNVPTTSSAMHRPAAASRTARARPESVAEGCSAGCAEGGTGGAPGVIMVGKSTEAMRRSSGFLRSSHDTPQGAPPCYPH
ncbi:hypothetical protein Misp02_55800 [Microtetraspora sp. NBRC 16547]|nr:hypothetical protein Misp02_55800 [Microtetraspora sp. NBRC 16547]